MAKNKSKVMWKIINGTLHFKKSKSKRKITKVKNSQRYVYNSSDIANSFNDFFVNIGKSMADKIPESDNAIHSMRVSNSLLFYLKLQVMR